MNGVLLTTPFTRGLNTEDWRKIFEKIFEDACWKIRLYQLKPMLVGYNLELEG